VNISSDRDKFLTKKVDILMAFNSASLEAQLPFLKEKATIIATEKTISKLNLENFNVLSMDVTDKYENTYLLGIYGKYLSLDLETLLEKVTEIFKKKGTEIIEKNKEIIKDIYKNYEIPSPLTPLLSVGEGKTLIY
jgi:Pyruvate/2-oxoacid:ferredoxin oxidoreductase gamma subunit